MDIQDQLKNLFPDHKPSSQTNDSSNESKEIWMQNDPIICKYENVRVNQ